MSETNLYIKKEFRELVNLLNTGNKLPNEKTEVYFYIDKTDPQQIKLFAAIDRDQKLLLCQTFKAKWIASKDTSFPVLSEFIANLLKYSVIEQSETLTQLVTDSVFGFGHWDT